jgi:hypothetical protein
MFGRPIPPAELMAGGADEALRRLEREIDAMRLTLRARIRRWTDGLYPARGKADHAKFTALSPRLARAS